MRFLSEGLKPLVGLKYFSLCLDGHLESYGHKLGINPENLRYLAEGLKSLTGLCYLDLEL